MIKTGWAASHDSVAGAEPFTQKSVLTIVGIGNDFRGDDAVGLRLIKQLEKSLPAGARTVELTGDQTYLLELFRSTNAVIVVDAVQSSAPAGTIFRLDVSEQSAPSDFLCFSTHSVDSATAIELARALDILPPKVLIYGIVGKEFSYTTRMEPELTESIEIVQARILKDVESILSGQSSGMRTHLAQHQS